MNEFNSTIFEREILFKQFSEDYFPLADDYVNYLTEFAKHYQLKISFSTIVEKINRLEKNSDADQNFALKIIVNSESHTINCKSIYIGTGNGKPFIPKSTRDQSLVFGYENFDQELVENVAKNGSVLILGKGNSAMETAQQLYGKTSFIHMVSRNVTMFKK